MLLLRTKQGTHGNGIMYGGETKVYMFGEVSTELFYVETDFGNHMKLTWSELNSMFEVVGVRDYTEWKADRVHLRAQPNLMSEATDEFMASNFTRS